MTAPAAVTTATARYSGLTVRLGQSSASTISSDERHAPTLLSSGPMLPPLAPTLWHDRHAEVGRPNTAAPRRGSPYACASATIRWPGAAWWGGGRRGGCVRSASPAVGKAAGSPATRTAPAALWGAAL